VGLSYVAGVAGWNHPSYRPPNIERIENAYDSFYRSLGADAAQAGFFFIDSEIAPRTYASHRCRKRAKRQFKSRLSEAAARAWNDMLIATAAQSRNPTQLATESPSLAWYNAGSRDFASYFPGGPGNSLNYDTLIGVIDKLDKQSAASAHKIETKKLEISQLEAEIATTRTICEAVISASREALDASFSRRSRTNIRSRRFDPSRVLAAAMNLVSVQVLGKPHPIIVADRGRDARQYGLAAAYYRKALSGSPELSPIWVQYGNMLKEEARLTEAEDAYRLALAQEPGNGDTHLQLAHLLKLQGRTGEAQNAYVRAFLLDRSLHESLRELGALGWPDDALALLRQLANAWNGSSAQRRDSGTNG
jgi:tetratricopeptide (TPR) repeat protein